jgi:hypothetical protein
LSGTAVGSVIWGVLDTFLRYRFLKKMLGTKYQLAFIWYYLGSLLYGQLNVRFVLAGTPWGNLVYLCGCAFALNMLLFHGSVMKNGFFTVWMYCAPEVAYGIFFPLFHGLAVMNGQTYCSDNTLKLIEYAAYLTLYVMMELLSRNLHVLKQDFEDRDAVYLTCIIVFICGAVDMLLNLFTGISEWTPENVLPVAGCLSLVALGGEILSVSCAVLLERRLVERLAKQQYQMLGKHMETSKEQYLQLVKIRHDIKNHGLCLAQLLADGKTEEARRYLEQMNLRMEQSEAVIQTGSVFADALLNPKCRRAKAMGIDLSVRLTVPDEETIAPVDLCCLLSNAFDNAAEACRRGLDAGKPAGWIRVMSQMHTNYWVFEISNSVHAPVYVQGERFLSSKRGSAGGVGLQNIRSVVERYGGVLDLQSGEQFTLSVMLPLASKSYPSASIK